MVENILSQARSLRAVMAHQYGEGRSALEEAAHLLRSGRRIVLSGMGASLYACIPFQNYLAARGVACSVIETSELLYFQSNILDAETVLVLVSRSGESVEATELLKKVHRGCKIVGLINVPGSTVARQATRAILVNSLPDQLIAIQTYTGTVVTLLLLGAAYAEQLDGSVKTDLERTIEVLTRCVPEWYRFSGSWPGFFANNVPMYLLGRGPTLASVQTGALLLQECAKVPAVPMSAPQFRHGPVEVVHDQFRVIIFGTQRNTEDLEDTLGDKILAMGGKVRWIGPKPKSHLIDSLCEWPTENFPDLFMPVADVIPLQMAAYHTARWHGITPGEFRFATPVTTSERDFFEPNDPRELSRAVSQKT
jgi:glucosamine--fructose-6-phosphate aminotransferase (isomerizing)